MLRLQTVLVVLLLQLVCYYAIRMPFVVSMHLSHDIVDEPYFALLLGLPNHQEF